MMSNKSKMKLCFILLIICIVLVLSIILLLNNEDNSNNSSDENIIITMSDSLEFNSVKGTESADKINKEAECTVCSYQDGVLRFTKSCTIRFNISDQTDYSIEFNDQSTQGIYVEEGIVIQFESRLLNKSSTDILQGSVIDITSNVFSITGKGTLIFNCRITGNSIVENYSAIMSICNLDMTDVKITISESKDVQKFGYGIHQTGKILNLYKSSLIIHALRYGIWMDCVNSKTVCDYSTLSVSGEEKALRFTGGYYFKQMHSGTFYVSENADGTYTKEYDFDNEDLGDFKYAHTHYIGPKLKSEHGGNYLVLILSAILVLVVICILWLIPSPIKKVKCPKRPGQNEK